MESLLLLDAYYFVLEELNLKQILFGNVLKLCIKKKKSKSRFIFKFIQKKLILNIFYKIFTIY